MRIQRRKIWGLWLVATLLGYAIGVPVAIAVTAAVGGLVSNGGETDILVGLCVGGSMGFTQAFVLRPYVRLAVAWIVGGAVGFGLPFTVVVAFHESLVGPIENQAGWVILTALIAGAAAGARQYFALKARVRKAGHWLWMSTVTGAALAATFLASHEPPLALLLGVAVYGLVGGGFIAHLLRSDGADPGSATKPG